MIERGGLCPSPPSRKPPNLSKVEALECIPNKDGSIVDYKAPNWLGVLMAKWTPTKLKHRRLGSPVLLSTVGSHSVKVFFTDVNNVLINLFVLLGHLAHLAFSSDAVMRQIRTLLVIVVEHLHSIQLFDQFQLSSLFFAIQSPSLRNIPKCDDMQLSSKYL